jgi:hypothetical protein
VLICPSQHPDAGLSDPALTPNRKGLTRQKGRSQTVPTDLDVPQNKNKTMQSRRAPRSTQALAGQAKSHAPYPR